MRLRKLVNDWQRNQIVPLNYLSTVPGADLHTFAELLHDFLSARALLLIPESVASKTQMWKKAQDTN